LSFPEGAFTIEASIADRGGNRSTVSRQCAIDTSSPQLSIIAPENRAAINDPQPLAVI